MLFLLRKALTFRVWKFECRGLAAELVFIQVAAGSTRALHEVQGHKGISRFFLRKAHPVLYYNINGEVRSRDARRPIQSR